MRALGGSQDDVQELGKDFYKALDVLRWTEGKTVRIEVRWAGSKLANIERHAAELVALKPDVILAAGTPAVDALKKATQSIPIVFAGAQDPVGTGLATSLARSARDRKAPVTTGLSKRAKMIPKFQRVEGEGPRRPWSDHGARLEATGGR